MATLPSVRDHALELERINRLYLALRHINQAIVSERSRDALFARVCEALVERGGFRMAWIGWYEPDTQRISPVACAGSNLSYVEAIRVYADERPEDRDPTGRAFREGRACICDDVLIDGRTTSLRNELQSAGFRASAAFPILAAGVPAGVLSVYADSAESFQDQEVALLEEAARDVSHAIDTLATAESRRSAQSLAQQEQNFASGLIEAMPGIFYFYDEQGRFIRWNRNFEVVSGYSAEDIRRMSPLDFFAAEDRALLNERIGQVFEHGGASVEAPFLTRSGQTIPHLFTGRRVEIDGLPCLLGVGIDVTEQKLAEEARRKTEERFRSTLDGLAEAGQLLDFEYRYLYLNPAAAVQNRRPNEELLGRRMPDMWPGIEQTPIFGVFKRCMEDRSPRQTETEYTFPDGTAGWFDVRVQPVPEGIFVLSLEISERKRAERALHELNERLEFKVAERTRELEAAKSRAEAADRLKSAFLATMSHELRTPLNSIIGFTGIILQGLAGPLNPEQEKQLGMVKGSARHLLELINDVLDISKIEAGQLEVRPARFDPKDALERVAGSIRPLVQKKGLELIVELAADMGVMTSDRRRVQQIALNLLNNAIKFTDAGSVKLIARVEGEEPARRLSVRIEDTGIGIREEDLSKLFQPFRQIDSGIQRQHEGTGLGLAICRRLAGLLGGSIVVESEWQRGSAFTLELPMGGNAS